MHKIEFKLFNIFKSMRKILPILARLISHTFVFVCLPLFMLLQIFVSWQTDSQKQMIDNVFARHEKILAEISGKQESLGYIRGYLRSDGFAPTPHENFTGKFAEIKRIFPEIFSYYFVNSAGGIISNVPNPPRFLLNKLASTTIFAHENYEPESLEKDWAMFRAFIGEEASAGRYFHAAEKIFQVSPGPEKKHFFYQLEGKNVLFVHISECADFEDVGIKAFIKDYVANDLHHLTVIGLQASSSPIKRKGLSQAFAQFRRTLNPHFVFEDEFISIKMLKSSSLLYIAEPRSLNNEVGSWRWLVFALIFVLFLLGAFFNAAVVLGKVRFFFPLRWRLGLLFLFTAAVPILAIVQTGLDYLRKTYRIDLDQAQKNLEANLKAVDFQLSVFRRNLQNSLNNYFIKFQRREQIDISLYKDELDLLAVSLKPDTFFIIGRSGLLKYQMPGKFSEKAKKGLKMFIELQVLLIKKLNKDPLTTAEEFKINALGTTGGIDVLGVMASGAGKIVDFSFGSNNGWGISLPIYNKEKVVSGLIFLNWNLGSIEKLFLASHKPLQSIIPQNARFYTSRLNGDERWPENLVLWKYLELNLSKLLAGEAYSFGTFNHQKRKYVVAAIRPKEMKEHYLFAVQSEEWISDRIEKLKKYLFLFCLACFLLSFFLGGVLSEKVLRPVGELKKGIVAISASNFKHKVEIDNNDELGELSDTFNHMIENLDEVSVAGQVQSRLFPESPLCLGDYAVHGKSISASRLGGDYFDYFVVQQRYLFVIVADVTGHGVPAALVMAMAKGVLVNQLESGNSLEEIVKALDLVLFKSLRRVLMMSAAIIWIDTQTHEITQFNAGHPYPIQFSVDNEVFTWKATGFPFGISATRKLVPEKRSIAPGEKVFLFSDGMIESIPTQFSEDQYLLFTNLIQSRPQKELAEICSDILACHPFWFIDPPVPQPDDFTILVIERKPL